MNKDDMAISIMPKLCSSICFLVNVLLGLCTRLCQIWQLLLGLWLFTWSLLLSIVVISSVFSWFSEKEKKNGFFLKIQKDAFTLRTIQQWHSFFSKSNDEGLRVLKNWKFHDFSVIQIQILCEINFSESRSSKIAVFAIVAVLNFVHLVNFRIPKVQKFIQKIQSSAL